MSDTGPIFIYCDWQAPAGVERASLALRDALRRVGARAELVSRSGMPVFGAEVLPVGQVALRGASLVFSRKNDLARIGPRALAARLTYWRHLPFGEIPRPGLDARFLRWMTRNGRIVCVCDGLADEIRQVPGVRDKAVSSCLSPLGMDLPATARIETAGPLAVLAFVGRPGRQKRLDRALAYVAEARAQEHNLRLLVFGYPKPPRVPDGVEFRPLSQDPRTHLGDADGLLVLSRYEGLPLTMVEAARLGLPIFAEPFRTGLDDFERLVGPVHRLDPAGRIDPSFARQDSYSGTYRFDAFDVTKLGCAWLSLLTEQVANV